MSHKKNWFQPLIFNLFIFLSFLDGNSLAQEVQDFACGEKKNISTVLHKSQKSESSYAQGYDADSNYNTKELVEGLARSHCLAKLSVKADDFPAEGVEITGYNYWYLNYVKASFSCDKSRKQCSQDTGYDEYECDCDVELKTNIAQYPKQVSVKCESSEMKTHRSSELGPVVEVKYQTTCDCSVLQDIPLEIQYGCAACFNGEN